MRGGRVAPEFGERALPIGGIGKAIGLAPEFHHGAAGISQHSKIQIQQPMCDIAFHGSKQLRHPTQLIQQLGGQLRVVAHPGVERRLNP